MNVYLSPYISELFYENQVIVANTKNGKYLKASKNYYLVLKKIIENNDFKKENNYSVKVLKNLTTLLNALIKIGCVKTENNFEEEYSEKLDVVYIGLTNQCNLQCKHCIAGAKLAREKEKCSIEDLINTVDQVIDLKPKAINITGGEPTIRKDFLDLLVYARTKFRGTIILTTNGMHITKKNANEISKLVDIISFSIDGYDEESCSKIRGREIFERVIKSIEYMKDAGHERISASMTITKLTQDNGKTKFEELCNKLQIEPIIRIMNTGGRAGENLEYLVPDKNINEDITKEQLSCKLCSPGKREIFIDGNGDIFPCGGLMTEEFKLGNIFDCSLKELVKIKKRDHEVISKVRPEYMEKCKDCEVNLFCHQCISNVYYLQENEKEFAKFCNSQHEVLKKLVWEG